MYDKSKKTWSQRLKITKTEKTHTATSPVTNATATTTAAAIANNAHISHTATAQYQAATAAAMHLPTLQLQQLNDYHNSNGAAGTPYEYLPSALSRSMKYAEPWIYGTVRGIPARPYPYHQAPNYAPPHAAAIFATQPYATAEALAVVICSCPEYLNGTKRDVKKASVCKKCKGSRLPLASIGGTVRLQNSNIMPAAKLRGSGAATMRVVSTTKRARPTILDPQKDPYDLMRRTRLLSPEPGAVGSTSSNSNAKDKTRNRGKSASPTRGRSRTRNPLPLKQTKHDAVSTQELADCWLEEDAEALLQANAAATNGHMRRSILRCNVNPYDLISIKSTQANTSNQTVATNSVSAASTPASTPTKGTPTKDKMSAISQNEFMPPNDDFNVEDAALNEEEPPFATSASSNVHKRNVHEITKSTKTKTTTTTTMAATRHNEHKTNADNAVLAANVAVEQAAVNSSAASNKPNYANVQAIAGKRISLGDNKNTKKSLIKQCENGRCYEDISVHDVALEGSKAMSRKDARQSNDANAANYKVNNKTKTRATTAQATNQPQPKRPPRVKKQESNESADSEVEKVEKLEKMEKIEKIEKTEKVEKVKSVATILPVQNAAATANNSVTLLTVTPTHNIKSILKRPISKSTDNNDAATEAHADTMPTLLNGMNASPTAATPTNQRGNNNAQRDTNAIVVTTPTATAQFYIPLPQTRKKVQFMVEDNIIHAVDSLVSSNGEQQCDSDEDVQQQYNTTEYVENVAESDEDVCAAVVNDDSRNGNGNGNCNDMHKNVQDYDVAVANANNNNNNNKAHITNIKSTSNYEYYNRKREQQKLLQQQQHAQQLTTTQVNSSEVPSVKYFNLNENSNDAALSQSALLAKLQHDSELVSSSLNAMATKTHRTTTAAGNNNRVNSTTSATNTNPNNDNNTPTFVSDTARANNNNNNNNNSNNSNNKNNNNGNNSKNINVALTAVAQTVTAASTIAKPYTDECNENPSANTKLDATHYEDVLPVAANATVCVSENATKQQQHIVSNKNSNKNCNNGKIVSIATPKLLLDQCHAESQALLSAFALPATATTTTTTPLTAATTLTTPTNPTAMPNTLTNIDTAAQDNLVVAAVDDDDDGDADDADDEIVPVAVYGDTVSADNEHPVKRATAATTTIAAALAAGDYDDNAEQQRPQLNRQQLQALSVNDSSIQLTQSRNPIRRSLSERQPSYNKLTTNNGYSLDSSKDRNGSSINGTTNNANADAILNFKDTMALRIKTNRNDSRDLFLHNITGTANNAHRPKEPPPPPPTPPPPATAPPQLALAEEIGKAAAHAAIVVSEVITAAATAVATKEFTTAIKSSENTLSLSPTGQIQQNVVDKDELTAPATATATNTYNTKTTPTTNAAATAANGSAKVAAKEFDCKQQQQQQQQPNKTNQSSCTNNSASCQEINSANLNDNKQHKQQISVQHNQAQQQHNKNMPRKTTNKPTTTLNTATTTKAATTPTTPTNYTGNRTVSSPQQRTVVRVAPFNKTTSEIHRLKISHTDTDTNCQSPTSPFGYHYNGNGGSVHATHTLIGDLYTQKKTSILINGDECYSTMNLSCDPSTPLYQSSVVVADYSSAAKSADNGTSCTAYDGLKVTTTSNTVTINVSSPRSAEEELIYQHNKINTLLSRQAKASSGRAIIPIKGTTDVNLQRSASSTSSTSTCSITSTSSSASASGSVSGSGSGSITKRGRTLIRLDYEKEKPQHLTAQQQHQQRKEETTLAADTDNETTAALVSHEQELLKILRNPVEAVKRNLVPHVCGRYEAQSERESVRNKKMKEAVIDTNTPYMNKEQLTKHIESSSPDSTILRVKSKSVERSSFIAKLLEDPMLSQVADGLETETVAELIENSLKRLKETRNAIDISGTKDSDDVNRLINLSLQKIKEERQAAATGMTNSHNSNDSNNTHLTVPTKEEDGHSNRGSISSANSFASANNYEMFDFDANESDCYHSCSSEITSPGDDDASSATTRSKFYQMLVDATLAEIELTTNMDDMDEHHYESIRNNGDPIYEEITDVPPPLPLTAPPLNDAELEKKAARSIFEGASKYDILSYLVDAKERGLAREEAFDYPLNCTNPIIIEEEACDTLSDLGKRKQKKDMSSRASVLSDSSEDNQSTMSSLSPPPNNFMCGLGATLLQRKSAASDIERNDSGVGSETSKSSRSKYQNPSNTNTSLIPSTSPVHLCEDCDGTVETQVSDLGVLFAPLVCRKCGKKRVERKEIITEIVETEEKYGRDLQIILEEFCHPMLVAGLLTQEQLSAIFLNTEELLENNQTLAERMRDALDIALEQGDDDLLTVNIGRIFLDFTQMLHAFESYCVRQAAASLLLANLEKEKELLRIFLKVSQMENAVLRRMNLNSFLMVPVQRVTKYPLLLARLYKVTPTHLEGRDLLKQAQEKIELHLNHINQEAKDVPTKLWRRISSSSPNRRASCEIDMINIKLRKMAIDVLEWNHDEVRFVLEGKLLYTQPTDSNWKKARTIKLTPVNALLVTNGKPSANYKAEKVMSDKLNFPKHTGIREASLLVVKEKCGRYTLIREPLYLDRCVVCSEADWDDYFEVQEISSKDTFIFKAEDGVRTKQWYTQLQYHAQGMGAWRKRRNALANIMINGMLARS